MDWLTKLFTPLMEGEIELPRRKHSTYRQIAALGRFLNFKTGPWVAGGSVRRLLTDDLDDDHDIDIFFRDEDQRNRFALRIKKHGEGQKNPTRLQLIRDRYFPTVDALLEDFDLSVCQFATDGRTIIHATTAMDDLNARQLRLNPLISEARINETRIARYLVKGYQPDYTLLERLKNPTIKGNLPLYGLSDEHVAKLRNQLSQVSVTEEFKRASFLSQLGDIHFERMEGEDICFLLGKPFPLPLAYIYAFLPNERDGIYRALKVEWMRLGLSAVIDPKQIHDRIGR